MPLPSVVNSSDDFYTWLNATNSLRNWLADPATTLIINGAQSTGNINLAGVISTTSLNVSSNLTVVGGINVAANLTHTGLSASFVSGALTANSTVLSATGIATATFGTTVNATGSLRVGTSTALIGAAVLSNTISVTGNATFSNTLSVTGATNVLSVFGVSLGMNALSTLGVAGAVNLASTLGVVGAAALTNTLSVTGNFTTNSAVLLGGPLGFNNVYVVSQGISGGGPFHDIGNVATLGAGANTYTVFRVTPDATCNVGGMNSGVSNNVHRQVLLFNTASSFDMTFLHESGGSTANNRFLCPTGADFTLPRQASALFFYDPAVSRWRIIGGGGSGGAANTALNLQGSTVQTNTLGWTVGANVLANVTSIFIGNSTANTVRSALLYSIGYGSNSISVNAQAITFTGSITLSNTNYGGTANNATNAFGKAEGALNVNAAVTCTGTAANATALNSKTEGNLNVNAAVTCTGTAANATALNSQLASYYTNASNMNAGLLPSARFTSASPSANGGVDTTTQSFSGAKTFQSFVTLSGGFQFDAATTGNHKLVLNTANGRLVIPVGVDKWAT